MDDAADGGRQNEERGAIVENWLVRNRIATVVFMLLMLASLCLGYCYGLRPIKLSSEAIVNFELGGSSWRAVGFVSQVGESALTKALLTDLIFIAGYGVALIGTCWVASRVFLTRNGRRLGTFALAAAFTIVASDLLENAFLGLGLEYGEQHFYRAASAFATIKFSLMLIAVPVALLTLGVVLKRAVGSLCRDRVTNLPTDGKGLPWPVQSARGDEWPALSHVQDEGRPDDAARDGRQHNRDAALLPPGRDIGEVGFCVSGGGIRSACVALGALQELRARLRNARYLVSVSGGGYMSGAMQLALYPDAPEGKTDPDPPLSRRTSTSTEASRRTTRAGTATTLPTERGSGSSHWGCLGVASLPRSQ